MKKIHILAAIIALTSNPIFATSEVLPPVPVMPEAPEAPGDPEDPLMGSQTGNPFINGNDAAGNDAAGNDEDGLVNNDGGSDGFPLDDPDVSAS